MARCYFKLSKIPPRSPDLNQSYLRTFSILEKHALVDRGTQRSIVLVLNYLLGRPLIPSDFLKRIVTSNFRDVCCFGNVKNVLGTETKVRSAIIYRKAIRRKVFGKCTKKPQKTQEYSSSPRITGQINFF